MNQFIGRALVLVLLLSGTACTTQISTINQGVRYVTVEEIQASLPKAPIVVGFDVDDTVLFSSPGFYYGLMNRDGPSATNIYGDDPLRSPKFWNDMNGNFDKFSLPKKSGGALVRMHHARGDTVVFITARNSSDISILSKILAQSFDIPKPKVVFTSELPKTEFIRERKVSIYYGDADSDMIESRKATARPVRIMRSPLSTNTASAYHLGAFGEEVLIHSRE